MGVLFLKKILEKIDKNATLADESFMRSEGGGASSEAVNIYNKILPEIKKKINSYFSWQFGTFLLGLILLGIHCIIMLV